MADRPKNVLLLWTDQQRADTVGPSKDPRLQMPNLERLAQRGAHFQHAYCAQPVCSPARATVMTGVYPHTHGVVDNNIVPDPGIPMITELLRPAGYVTGYNGKWHLGNELQAQRGFDHWVSTEEGYARSHAEEGYSSYHQFLEDRGYTPTDPHLDGMTFGRHTAAALPEEVGEACFPDRRGPPLPGGSPRPALLPVGELSGAARALRRAFRTASTKPEDVTLPDSWYGEMEASVPLRYRRLRAAYARRLHGWPSPLGQVERRVGLEGAEGALLGLVYVGGQSTSAVSSTALRNSVSPTTRLSSTPPITVT